MSKSKIPDLNSIAMPPVKEYLTAVQRDGAKLCAEDIFRETTEWLKMHNCENIVSKQTVEQYAMSVARWIHLEEMISKYGYIAKHPTTGAPMQSPYVQMAQGYLKQVSALRAEILLLVKDARPTLTETVREVVYGG